MKKVFTLLTLLLAVCSGAWAEDAISCSAYLSSTAKTPTVTNCTLTMFSDEGTAMDIPAGTSSSTYYYSKMNNDKNYYVVTLNQTVGDNAYSKFKAGDIITVYLYANGSTIAFKLGSSKKEFSESKTKGSVYDISYTLTASDIESDGTIRIYRNSSNTHFAGIAVTGTRITETFTVTFNAGSNGTCETASLTEASAAEGITLPSVTPNSGFAFNGWFTAAEEGEKAGDDGDTYFPTANITLYAQYVAPTAPGISIDNATPSTVRGKAITFTATPTGSPAPTVTWYQSETATTSGGTEKSTGNTYQPDVTTEGTYYYYAIADNGVEPAAVSELITLTVNTANIDRSGYNTYYVAEKEYLVGGKQIICDDITMTYSNVTYNSPNKDEMIKSINSNYVASATSGTNNWSVTFVATSNGQLAVGLVANNGKEFSITNVTSFEYEDKDGNSGTNTGNTWTPSEKFYGIVTIDVVAGTSYTFTVSGSKMSLYGFEFTPTTSTPITLATSGKSTFCSNFALDCANLPTGLKAYKVSAVSATSATLTEVTEAVAAGTGLILIGTGSASYDIPVAATGTDISASNKLVGVTADKALTAGEAFLLSNGTFVPCKAGTLKAGKAYLPTTSGARSLSLVFEGETTGINAIENAETINGIYNLNGQRVAQPTRGLYIMNGKKIIVK